MLVAFVGNIFLNIGGRATSGIAGHIPAIFAGLCVIVGVTSGIIALFGMRRHGREGLLIPALIGIGLWVFLAAIAIPAFNAVRRKALALQRPTSLAPATHDAQASQIRDTDLGFSFDLPEGYQEFAKSAIPPGVRFAYVKPGGTAQNSVLLVKPLGGQLPRRHLRSDEVPGGKSFSLLTFPWRGLAVDTVRVEETINGAAYLTFNVQIPLRKEAVQISFGGPAEQEAPIRLTAGRVLSSLEGESNW